MDVTIHLKRSDFHSGESGEREVFIRLTRQDFHAQNPEPVNFIGASEISTRAVGVSNVPKPMKLIAANIPLPVPQVIVIIKI